MISQTVKANLIFLLLVPRIWVMMRKDAEFAKDLAVKTVIYLSPTN